MRRMKKAQAALEFLMTYGWAFMVILIMIAALAYFGVLNPDRILPDRATVPHPFQHMSGELRIAQSTTDSLGVGMMNSFGRPIKIANISARTDYGGAECLNYSGEITIGDDTTMFDSTDDLSETLPWPDGQTGEIFVNCDDGDQFPAGSRIKGYIDVEWFSAASSNSFGQTARIEISAVVQD